MRLLSFMFLGVYALGADTTCDPTVEACDVEDDDEEAFLQVKLQQTQMEGHAHKEDDEEDPTTNALKVGENATGGARQDLIVALPIVLVNLTNYSGLITMAQQTEKEKANWAPSGKVLEDHFKHVFGVDTVQDVKLLTEMTQGFFTVLREALEDDVKGNADKYCPIGKVSVIRRCIDMALCISQKHTVTIKGPPPNMETYTLFEELSARFEEISWDNILSSLAMGVERATDADKAAIKEALGTDVDDLVSDGPRVPKQYACDGGEDWLKDAKDPDAAAFVQTSQKAAAYQTSVALVESATTTHAVLDAHMANSSVENTLNALYEAWSAPCKLLGCDHKNYFDLYGASHSHSLALIDAGASAAHMRVHIRTRMRLERRMQRFLGEHGVQFMGRMYTDEGTSTVAQMQSYISRGKNSFMEFLEQYASAPGADRVQVWLNFLNWDRMKAYFEERGQLDDYNRLWAAHYNGDLSDDNELDDAEAPGDQETADTALVEASQELTGRRRLFGRRRRRIIKAIVKTATSVAKAVVSVGDAIKNAVNSAVSFLTDLFACLGAVKSMVKVGYAKKFPPAPPPGVTYGIGTSMTAATGGPLKDLVDGKFTPNLKVGIGVVFGAVPFTPVSGGIRTGVGVGGNVACSPAGCSVGISVGPVASALIPTNGPKCFVGTYLGDYACMIGAGVSLSAVCCSFNLVTGSSGCR